ncbi:MAG: ABC transporter ATP-binding protein [Candidatus Dormibacteraeota bacterium]|nr:ABC transporter ATP-binding protein [Candidatus Dormibacteraeota bacterium]
MSLLEVRGLRAGYQGIPVVFGLDLDLDEGEIVAVLGANGAGKTTTMRAISGMLRPMAGTVVWDGIDITGKHADAVARMGLIHVPEGRGLFPSLGVDESLRLAASMASVPRAEIGARLDDIYAVFPLLAKRKHQPAGTLSGGEQQMLALARGIVVRPRLLLIDEMSQGLAPTVVAGLFDLVATFPERGTSVLLVEQFVGKALSLSKRAYVLEKGTVGYEGTSADLSANADFVRSSYLGHTEVETPAAEAAAPTTRRRASARGPAAEEVKVALPPALMRSLSERAQREGVPVGELVARALRGELDGEHDGASKKEDTKAQAVTTGGGR